MIFSSVPSLTFRKGSKALIEVITPSIYSFDQMVNILNSNDFEA